MQKIFVKITDYWKLAGVLKSSGFFGRVRLFVNFLWVIALKKLIGRKPRLLRLEFEARKFVFFVRDAADIAVLVEMFLNREYDLRLGSEPRTIVDIGSHIGASAVFLKIKYPKAQVVCYEPDLDNFGLLVKNTSQFEGVKCMNLAVSSSDGEALLQKRAGSSISGTIVGENNIEIGDSSVGTMVKTTSLDMILGKFAMVDLIKFDVEGAEYELFKASKLLDRVRGFVGELHLDLIGSMTKDDFCSIFKMYNVSMDKLTDSRYIIKATKK